MESSKLDFYDKIFLTFNFMCSTFDFSGLTDPRPAKPRSINALVTVSLIAQRKVQNVGLLLQNQGMYLSRRLKILTASQLKINST